MPLDPQCAALIDAAAAAGPGPFGGPDHLSVRAGYEAGTAVYRYDPGPVEVSENTFSSAAGERALRIYRPTGTTGALPALVFFHGGGWVVGSLDSHDHLCRHLCHAGGIMVIAVDYRLAPEHPFPAALDDSLAATRDIARRASSLGVDASRLAVGGDSAGGQLATNVALALRDDPACRLAFQLLIYPVCDLLANNASVRDNAKGYLLTLPAYHKMCDWYLGDRVLWGDPRVSPQRESSHGRLPPAFIQTAEFDPLRDEGLTYAATLANAGVKVDYRCYPGMIHGFARMGAKVDGGRRALDDAARALAEALHAGRA